MSLDLKLLEKSLDDSLAKETKDSLKKWFSKMKKNKKPHSLIGLGLCCLHST